MSLPSSGPNGCVEESALCEWFRLGEEIGRGATGRVYKAENLVSGQTVAIKKIPLGPTAAQQQSNLQCLMGEIELLKSLNHQNIVQFLGSCRTRTHLYIMLEYMEKGSLSSIIKQGVKLSEELAAVYIAQVLQGLRYLHAQGVVHRDIKGANILTNKQVRIPRQHGHAWSAAACTEQLRGRPGQRDTQSVGDPSAVTQMGACMGVPMHAHVYGPSIHSRQAVNAPMQQLTQRCLTIRWARVLRRVWSNWRTLGCHRGWASWSCTRACSSMLQGHRTGWHQR